MSLQGADNSGDMGGSESLNYNFDFAGQLPEIQKEVAELSVGFLRCRPEKWFPSISSHWLPFWHSLGIEIRIVEVKTSLKAPGSLEKGFYGVVDEERVAVCLEAESENILLSAVSPGIEVNAQKILLEYLARRFFSTIALSWSAEENAKVNFRSEILTHSFEEAGAVKITFSLNNSNCNLWILLGEKLVSRFDGLWRRQLVSPQKEVNETVHSAAIELLACSMNEAEIRAQIKHGHFLSFAGNKLDLATLLIDEKPHLPVKICKVNDSFAFQTASAGLFSLPESEAKLRLSVRLPSFQIRSNNLAEVSQVSSYLISTISTKSPVEVFVQGKKLADAQLAYSLGNLGVLIK